MLFCYTGIISAGRMHLYLAFLLHRDYFDRPDASLSCFSVPQGLFPPAECISVLLFFTIGIISAARIHLYLAFLFHRDYFRRPDSSLSSSFAPQGLFPPPGFISILLLSSTGIISSGRMHLYLPLLLHRDDFRRPDASLPSSFVPQGLFPPVGFIPSLLFCYTGIISAGRIHPQLALFHHRDDFRRSDSSLPSSFAPQGLFCPGWMHLYLPLLLHRDYSDRPDASLSCFSVPQRLFPPAGCISILLFCSTEIISTGRMHLYLPLLSHRDYFGQPNASLSSSFASQGLFPPALFALHFPQHSWGIGPFIY